MASSASWRFTSRSRGRRPVLARRTPFWKQSGEHLDDDSALLLMARHVLASRDPVDKDLADSRDPSDGRALEDAGRASYQLALTLCEGCGSDFQDACGERLEVDAAIIEMAHCDAQHIGRIGRAVVRSDSAAPCQTTQPHVGRPETQVIHRATQTIPPALRRHVVRRDQGRCVVPGCRHTIFIDVHHLELRSEGGRHDADNLVVLCTAHHRAVHQGQLIIIDRASTGLRFEHADGTPYGHAPSPHTIDTLDRVYRGLRGLGFKEREARRALDAATEKLRTQGAARALRTFCGPRSVASVLAAHLGRKPWG